MKILEDHKIRQKINRLAIQIIENNLDHEVVALVGINRNGLRFAELLHQQIVQSDHELKSELYNVLLNPKNPLSTPVTVAHESIDVFKNKTVIIVDDVANTGRTIFYACMPLMSILPDKIEVAVLVDRQHKTFPICVNYKGISLATTLKEHIHVNLEKEGDFEVRLS